MKYDVVLYKNENDSVGTLIHSSYPNLPKLHAATLTQGMNVIDSGEFSMGINSPGYNLLTPMRSRIKVFKDNDLIFHGRVIKSIPTMDSSGLMMQTFDVNSVEDYLHDSCQVQQKVSSCTVAQYFQAIIGQHNSQVEDYKKFSVGTVTVTDSAGYADRYLDYEDTFDAITNRLIDVYGGYITVDYDTMTINYLASVGSKSTTPLRIGFNMKSAQKTVDPTSVVTRLIPTGAHSSTDSSTSTDTSSLTTDKQITTAKTTLANQGYVDNQALIDEFGIIVGTQNFDGVTDTATLQQKAQNWLSSQSAVKESWEISVSNLHLIDKTIDDFKVGNQYQFINDFVAPTDWLQVAELDLDLVTPTNSTIKIGDVNMNLSAYLSGKIRRTQNLHKKLEYLTNLASAQASTISKISSSYSDLSDQFSSVVSGNSLWSPGAIFIDLSSNNGSMSVSDFTSLYSAGVRGLIDKLTESTDYTNSLFDTQTANAVSAGIKTIGTYHYYKGGGASEAQYYLSQLQAKNIDKSLIVACDVEDSSLSTSESELNTELTAFFKVLTDAGYTNTCLYGSLSWFDVRFSSNLAKYTWKAAWGSTKPSSCSAWQYTDKFNGLSLDASRSYDKAFI
ncbi:phage tail spike protein [Liquorilactobacillus vini]|uniref:phage tail spike protein n=1 Tax=Liquorilactobacillus vini TaxID=238015 RepID=UPI00031F2049|nr:phage tail spike protein [Liquorilactobacillus vini]